MSEHFDPSSTSAEISAATARLLHTVRSMSDADVPAPSLLPGWSRGHVLTHIARNADGLINLMIGAIEGVERKAYPSKEAREADIEAGASRPIREHLADIEASHRKFFDTVSRVAPSQWEFVLSWGSAGQKRPVRAVLDARLREVAIHHIDLDAGYTPADWPPEFALRILRSALPAFEVRGMAACTLRPTDVDAIVEVSGGSQVEVSGETHALATWVLGRDAGSSLKVTGGELPSPPTWG
jgi:maleylpyruvate isomerase